MQRNYWNLSDDIICESTSDYFRLSYVIRSDVSINFSDIKPLFMHLWESNILSTNSSYVTYTGIEFQGHSQAYDDL